MIRIQRALLSCWDKQGLTELARGLQAHGVEIISSGGTATFLEQHHLPVTRVEALTQSPEVLGGRVKTLHPRIHAAILATDSPEHQQDLQTLGVQPIQLVVVNLYPFVEAALEKGLAPEEAVEFIDIGGPALLRAAAKNYRFVVALHHPGQYEEFLAQLNAHQGAIPEHYSRRRAQEVFFYTGWYDGQIQAYFSAQVEPEASLPRYQTCHLEKVTDLRYGENPHQAAALYRPFGETPRGMAEMEQLGGKPLSFNNYVDVQAAYALALEFSLPAAVIVKHTNPCGAAVDSENLIHAYRRALQGDPVSAFGGIVACNREIDAATAEEMSKIFLECIIAPDFSPGALERLRRKKNLRLLKLSPETFLRGAYEIKPLSGAYLLQQPDDLRETPQDWRVVTRRSPTDGEWEDMEFAWKVVKHVKSNAIVLAKDGELYGVGAGQMSRVDAVEFARMKAEKAGRELTDTVLASDAFFPFRDGIDEAAKAGVSAVIQPGGSIRDEEVIQAADEHGMTMIFTGRRHFKH
ncbi:MAG: bifunctional phosphoribosylaminoimidazolecarboxamide formyltransferase/IMP cyclohydrolase PurH [Calditrichaeota bacterium]|nr:MAG: bifunctional phosphoribosylaminoimidazolecarboxamide formyltransferase/IMP cyclohydrolase PurH [Calditrichota bacterium]